MQTSIEWYSNKLLEILGDKVNEFTQEQTLANHYILKQAKEMHKQETINTFDEGKFEGRFNGEKRGEQYYQETFKKN